MKILAGFILSALLLVANESFSQTFQTSGNWATDSNWSTGTKPSGTGVNVTISANPTISTTEIIGSVTDGNTVGFTITGSGNLSIGASGTPKNMTFNNSGSITINSGGVLEIWGDLNVKNNLTLTVTGQLIVHGNINMNDNATISVGGGGTVTVGGNLTGQQNTQLSVSIGTINVAGALSLGNGTSSITVTPITGHISAGSCSCTGCPALTLNCSSVPIKLLFFKGSPSGRSVVLNWATVSEINFDYFVLERSADGRQFSEIGRVEGAGNSSSRKDYSYVDADPLVGSSYYRLTSIDFDGYTEVFNENVVHVTFQGEKHFHVYPNPVVGSKLSGKINFNMAHGARVQVFNSLGVLLSTFEVDQPSFDLQLSTVSNGVFFVRFSSDELNTTVRLTMAQ